MITSKQNLMDAFKSLSQKSKIMIVSSAMFLLTLSIGVLVFGSEALTSENSLIKGLKGSIQADMLYSTPTEGAH